MRCEQGEHDSAAGQGKEGLGSGKGVRAEQADVTIHDRSSTQEVLEKGPFCSEVMVGGRKPQSQRKGE